MPSSAFCIHTRSIYSNIASILLSFFYLNPKCLSRLPHIKCLCWIYWLCFVRRQTFSFHFVEVWLLDSGLVWLHRSHYLKSFALKQKVRDQQILTSGQAYDSILMQFSNSSSLTSPACLPARQFGISSVYFRGIPTASGFAKFWHGPSIPPARFPIFFFLFSCICWHICSEHRLCIWEADPLFGFIREICYQQHACTYQKINNNLSTVSS